MLQNYFTMAWRSLLKNKGFSIINILGLSAGIAFTLLIGAYVWGELQVNRQLKMQIANTLSKASGKTRTWVLSWEQ